MEAHGEDLREASGDLRLVEALKKDPGTAPLTDADRALVEFSIRLTERPSSMSRKDVQRLRDVGFDDPAILEAVHIVGYFNYINRVADALGVDPEPEWEKMKAGQSKKSPPAGTDRR